MKHNILKRALIGSMAVLCVTGSTTAVTAFGEEPVSAADISTHVEEPVPAGGWELVSGDTSADYNPDAAEAFKKATEQLDGVSYELVAALAKQCVAGTNYCLLCKVKAVVPNARTQYQIIYIYEDLKGNAEITGRKTIIGDPAPGSFEGNDGDTSLEGNEDVLDAFNDAIKELDGVDYYPISYIGSQLVAGTNYMILCRAKVVVPNAVPSFKLVTVYKDLSGNAAISDIRDVVIGEIDEEHHEEEKPVIYISYERGDNAVKLSWVASKEVNKYAVCGFYGNSWKLIAQGYNTSYILKGLKPGNEYKVAVIAMVDGAWNKDFSNAIFVTPNDSKVPEISYEEGENSVKLTWNEIDGAKKYAVAGYVAGKWKKLAEGYNTSYVLKGLKPGKEYKVAVSANIDGRWVTDFSNAIVVTPKQAK